MFLTFYLYCWFSTEILVQALMCTCMFAFITLLSICLDLKRIDQHRLNVTVISILSHFRTKSISAKRNYFSSFLSQHFFPSWNMEVQSNNCIEPSVCQNATFKIEMKGSNNIIEYITTLKRCFTMHLSNQFNGTYFLMKHIIRKWNHLNGKKWGKKRPTWI